MAENTLTLRPEVKRRLRNEYFIWFTTVGSDLSPQPRPVWFIWEAADDSFLIYSQPKAYKVRHIRHHPNVALHFNADQTADKDVLVLLGTAGLDPDAPPAHMVPAYMRKYREGIAALNMTPEEFSREYSLAIRVKPTSIREG
ncbi:MAG: TIGR03667 family PPOX class F420-dependent oxidoreductase [Anaerolineales bacterium]